MLRHIRTRDAAFSHSCRSSPTSLFGLTAAASYLFVPSSSANEWFPCSALSLKTNTRQEVQLASDVHPSSSFFSSSSVGRSVALANNYYYYNAAWACNRRCTFLRRSSCSVRLSVSSDLRPLFLFSHFISAFKYCIIRQQRFVYEDAEEEDARAGITRD